MSAIKTLVTKYDQKISIAIIGLVNSGKTALVKRILQTDEHIQASIGSSTGFELQIYGNLTLLTWDLANEIPKGKTLWERSIMGADVVFFMVDSTERDLFQKNRALIAEFVEERKHTPLLILGSKSDITNSATVGEMLEELNVIQVDKTKCKCDLFKFSARTGEGMYAIEEWLNRVLFKQKERIIDYVKISACVSLCEETSDFVETILTSAPDIKLITTIHALKRKTTIFSRTQRIHGAGEEVIEIGKFKVVLVKGKSHVVALIVNQNDSVPRTIEISRNILQIINTYCNSPSTLNKTIRDLYPLDIAV